MSTHDDRFSGRTIPDSGFAGDDGAPDPSLLDALDVWTSDEARAPEVLWALSNARVFVPVVAVATEAGVGVRGLTSDKKADMAIVLLRGNDGRNALPVFLDVASLSQWHPQARPVPVDSQRAALYAYDEGNGVLVVQPDASRPFVVQSRDLAALAEGVVGLPLYADADVAAELHLYAAADERIADVGIEAAQGADARVVVTVRDAASAPSAAEAFSERLSSSTLIRARVLRGLDVVVNVAPATT